MRLIATAVTLALFCFGVVNAEEFLAKIIKVDGTKVTLTRAPRTIRLPTRLLTAADKVKVVKGKYDKEAKKIAAPATPSRRASRTTCSRRLARRVFALSSSPTTPNKKITEIRVMTGGKKKGPPAN